MGAPFLLEPPYEQALQILRSYFSYLYGLVRYAFEDEALDLLRPQEGALVWQNGLLQLFRYIAENRAVCLCGEIRQTPEELIVLFTIMFQEYITGVSVRLAGLTAVPQSTEGGTPWEIMSLH